MDQDLHRLSALLVMPAGVELSVFTGVAGWGCPSSLSVVPIGTASCPLTNSPPTLALAAEAMTGQSLWQTVWMGPLGSGLLVGTLAGLADWALI
jgi:hypothetical protein